MRQSEHRSPSAPLPIGESVRAPRQQDRLRTASSTHWRVENLNPNTSEFSVRRRERSRNVLREACRFHETLFLDREPRGKSDTDAATPDQFRRQCEAREEELSLLKRRQAFSRGGRSRTASLRNDHVPETTRACPSAGRRWRRQTCL